MHVFQSLGIGQGEDVDPEYLHPIVRPKGYSSKNKISALARNNGFDRVSSVANKNEYADKNGNVYDPNSPRSTSINSPVVLTPEENQSAKPLLYRMPSNHYN